MTEPGSPSWWDERYASKPLLWGSGPNRFVAEAFAARDPWGSKRALDLACGEGRNALWLAERGWESVGIDFSPLALERARGLSEERGLKVEWIAQDLTHWVPQPDRFALIVVAYLQVPRPFLSDVLARCATALEPGGELFGIGHARRNLSEGVGGPRSPEALWDPDELAGDLRAVGLEVSECAEVLRPVEGEGDAIDLRCVARRG